MSESNSTTVEATNSELCYYQQLENYINSLGEKFREKSVIKQNVYNDIVKCLLLTKVQKNICVYENYYSVIGEAHATISHGGRIKTVHELSSHYSWIPRFAIEIFLKQCVVCVTRKPIKQHIISQPIISLGVMTRLQIDLIDMRTKPDVLSPHLIFNWILHCIDHFSKFTWGYSLKSKSAIKVASKLRELFFIFGPPRILHSDNGREFVANVIFELKQLFPDLLFIRGKPRHPQSQGCIERANGVLSIALGKWMSVHNSSHWSNGLLPVVYGINTRLSSVTKTSPYQVMFGQQPRSNSDFWKIVQENGIIDEENLPTPVADSTDNVMEDTEADVDPCADVIDQDIIQLVQRLSDEVVAKSLVAQSSNHPSSVQQSQTNHEPIREAATNNYLNVANKKLRIYQNSIFNEAKKFNLNDCVGVKIHSVDRTNTDAKLLPCLITEKIEKGEQIMFKLACQYGKLENTYSVEELVDLKMACPQELKQIVIGNLKIITFIEACKLYVRGSTTGRTCDCKGKCGTKQCPCKKMGMFCSTKCHSKRGGCTNMD